MDDWEYRMGPADWPLELPDGRTVRMGDATDEQKAAATALLVERAKQQAKEAQAERRRPKDEIDALNDRLKRKRDFRTWLAERETTEAGGGAPGAAGG